MAKADTLFMSIPTIQDLPGKSFEEVRIQDYLDAYRTTGRPPAAVPQEPVDDRQRGLLNLPPLFKPHPIQHDTAQARPAPSPPVFSNLLVANKTQKPPVPPAIANPEDLPAAQEFLATTSDSETSQSISVMPAFRGFSPEELRYHAYLKGHKLPPSSVQMSFFTQVPPNLNSPSNETVLQRPAPSVLASSTASETLVSISTQSDFTDHSFEELRVACLQAGRELNSHEISLANAASGVPLLSRSSLFMGTGGGAFAHAPPVRPF